MFYNGDFVRSPFFGLGRVLLGGAEPVVCFLAGPTCPVSEDSLIPVPHSVYWARVENERRWERYLNWYLYGVADPEVFVPSPFGESGDGTSAEVTDGMADVGSGVALLPPPRSRDAARSRPAADGRPIRVVARRKVPLTGCPWP
jgi:hypothetical protein